MNVKLHGQNRYTVEQHKAMVYGELKELGYSEEVINEWVEYIE